MSAYGRCTTLGVLFAATLGACDDSTTAPAEPLNMDETEALYLGIQALVADTTASFVAVTPDGGVVACPLGGQVTVAVDFREEQAADTARLITNVTLDPAGCMLSSEEYEFTLDGNPNVHTVIATGIVGSTFEFHIEGSITGGVDWQLDDRSGTCMIDLILSAEIDTTGTDPTPRATFSGTMCGLEVEFEAAVVQVPG
ncbi:MAG: hypothetical protein OXH51_00555 [Gemmatimonadetes bacterium]|nr:hypothetical protein [Gemmatimonadota bacterium]